MSARFRFCSPIFLAVLCSCRRPVSVAYCTFYYFCLEQVRGWESGSVVIKCRNTMFYFISNWLPYCKQASHANYGNLRLLQYLPLFILDCGKCRRERRRERRGRRRRRYSGGCRRTSYSVDYQTKTRHVNRWFVFWVFEFEARVGLLYFCWGWVGWFFWDLGLRNVRALDWQRNR